MTDLLEKPDVQTIPGQPAEPLVHARNQAISMLVPFAAIRQFVVGSPPPKRPNRASPIHVDDPDLAAELAAWDAASDEALERFEDTPPE